jgi:hypothetical protein
LEALEGDTSTAIRRSLLLLIVAAATAVGLTLAMSSLGSSSVIDPTASERMVAVSPGGHVQIDELAPELRQMYLNVAADPEAFEQVRCYCGCEATLDHRHLRDCFERPDGGWERHAVGCAVCQLEARDVLAGRAAGQPMADIITEIDRTYAEITGETS